MVFNCGLTLSPPTWTVFSWGRASEHWEGALSVRLELALWGKFESKRLAGVVTTRLVRRVTSVFREGRNQEEGRYGDGRDQNNEGHREWSLR